VVLVVAPDVLVAVCPGASLGLVGNMISLLGEDRLSDLISLAVD
jgi:hypothetical protein